MLCNLWRIRAGGGWGVGSLVPQKPGSNEFAKSLRKYGQFSPLNIEGLKTAEALLPAPLDELSTMTVAYVHGIANTPLQAGVVRAAMVNGGYSAQPTLYKIDPENAACIPVMSEAASSFMWELMRKNATDGTGTTANIGSSAKVGKPFS